MESWSTQKAEQVALELFNVKAIASRLPGYEDANYLLDTKRDQRRYFVLKVVSQETSINSLECQHSALQHLIKGLQGFSGPIPVLSINKRTIELVDGEHVRILTYIPGSMMASVKSPPSSLYQSLGEELGKIDRCLLDFNHEYLDREIEWDLANLPSMLGNLRLISDLEIRSHVSHFLEMYSTKLVPILARLRKSAIHNDVNDHNIIVQGSAILPQKVEAIIDYGDLIKQALVFDPAIALAYAIMNEEDVLKVADNFIKGYVRQCPLHEIEVDLLHHLVGARLAQSLLMSAEKRRDTPDDFYFQISDLPAREAIKKWKKISPRYAAQVLRKSAGLPFLEESYKIENWIRENRVNFHTVILDRTSLSSLPSVDLSVASPLFDDPAASLDIQIEENCLGRYQEPRLVYQGDNYLEGSNRRTIHLGIDVFAPAKTAVFAPMESTVLSVQDNVAEFDFGPTVILEHEIQENLKFWTLYGHLSRTSIVRLREGQKIKKGAPFATLGDKSENGNWSPHLHFQLITNLLGQKGNFSGVANFDYLDVWKRICPDPSMLLGVDSRISSYELPNKAELLARRNRVLSSTLSTSYDNPIKIVKGFGSKLYSETGKQYLDCVNNVCHVGHSNPRIVESMTRQAKVLNTNTRYLHENIVELSSRLREKLPSSLEVCFFVNSGSEANDLALRLAKAATQKENFLVIDSGYHGHTNALIEVSPYKFKGKGGSGKSTHVEVLPMPDTYRGLHQKNLDNVGELYAEHAVEKIASLNQRGGLAAFIGETILSCGGQIEPPPGYLKSVYEKVRASGGICIADEVQTGFGRMGSHFWAFETQEVIPDIVTMGKPMGNGHPIAAVVTTRKIAEAFANGMEYFNTFGGNPVSCAVGLAVLHEIDSGRLQENARVIGRHFMSELLLLQKEVEEIGEVRGRGLFLGVELVKSKIGKEPNPELATKVVERMKEKGVLLSTDGPDNNVLKIKPPMVFSRADVDHVISELRLVFNLALIQKTSTPKVESISSKKTEIVESLEPRRQIQEQVEEPVQVKSTIKAPGEIRQESLGDMYGKLKQSFVEQSSKFPKIPGTKKKDKSFGGRVKSIWKK